MKPWVFTDKNKMSSVGAALTARVLGHLLWGCAAPTGLNKCVPMLNPGLAPWALQECRPYRALLSKCVVKIGMEEGSIVLILPYYAMASCLAWWLKAQKSAFGHVIRSLRIKKTSPKYAVFQRA